MEPRTLLRPITKQRILITWLLQKCKVDWLALGDRPVPKWH